MNMFKIEPGLAPMLHFVNYLLSYDSRLATLLPLVALGLLFTSLVPNFYTEQMIVSGSPLSILEQTFEYIYLQILGYPQTNSNS